MRNPNQTTATEWDACAMLPKMRAALFALVSGATVSEVRNANDWLKFMPAGGDAIATLKHMIREAEIECDPRYRPGRAVRMGPVRPVGRYFGW